MGMRLTPLEAKLEFEDFGDDPARAFEAEAAQKDRFEALETIVMMLMIAFAQSSDAAAAHLIGNLRGAARNSREKNEGTQYIRLLEGRADWLAQIVARRRGADAP
jgi:hypothetical protein